MTNRELVDKYLAATGRRRSKDEDSCGVILPYLMLDAVQIIYSQDIASLPFKHEARRYRNKWKDNYNLLNHEFFMAFSDDERDEVIEKMDALGDYISHDLMIMRYTVQNAMALNSTDEEQQIFSSLFAAYCLAKGAADVWEEIFVRTMAGSRREPRIEAVTDSIYKLAKTLPCCRYDMTERGYKEVQRANKALCNKILRWLDSDRGDNKVPEA